jgi:cytochrome bd-type quinol oxidase subunit 2
VSSPTYSRRRDPPRRRRRVWRWILGIALLAAVFAIGVALGQALHDNPKPGATVTEVRTLTPLPLAPAKETVTVTAGARR